MRKKEVTNKKIIIYVIGIITIIAICLRIINKSDFIQSDTAWHIKNGEFIIKNGIFPRFDVFSIHDNLKFISHEWLSDVTMYFLQKEKSLMLLEIITSLIFISGYIIAGVDSNNVILSALIFLIFTLSNLYKQTMAIPDTFAVVLLLIMVINQIKSKKAHTKIIRHLILTVLLSNCHGGFLTVSIIQTALISLAEIFNNKKSINSKIIITEIIMIGGSLIAGCVNPYGPGIYKYIIMVDNEIAPYMSDWISFYFDNVFQIAFFFVLITFIIVGFVKKKNKDWREAAVFIFYTLMLFRYRRCINQWIMVAMLIVPSYISFKNVIFNKIITYITACSGIVISIMEMAYVKFDNVSMTGYIRQNYFTEEAMSIIKDHNIFNTLECSGFLIYADIPVYIDGRIDPYSQKYNNEKDILNEYISALYIPETMDYVLNQYNIDTLILNNNTPSAQIFKYQSKWTTLYSNENIIILRKGEIKERDR